MRELIQILLNSQMKKTIKKILIVVLYSLFSLNISAQYIGGIGDGYSHQFLENKLPSGGDFQFTLNENSQYSFSESDFPFSDEDGYFSGVQIIGLESGGDLEYQNTNVLANQTIVDVSQLVFKTISYQYGWPYATINFKVIDNEGGISVNTYTITVYVVHNPMGANISLSTNEDDTLLLSSGNFSMTFGQNRVFESIIIKQLPTKSILRYNKNTAQSNTEYADLNLFSYIPYPDSNGTAYDYFSYQIRDNKGFNSDSIYYTYFNVNPMPDAPVSADTSITFNEDEIFNFANAHFSFSDIDGDIFGGIYLESLPSKGELSYSSNSLSVGDTCTNLAQLNYAAPQNANGSPYTSFYFKVVDTSPQVSKQIYRMTINILPVADNPTAIDTTIAAQEDQTYTFSVALFGFSDVDGDAFAGIQLQNLPDRGSLLLNGQKLSAVSFISDVSKLSFLANANEFGTAYTSFSFIAKDASGSYSNPHSISINVLSVNDAPISKSYSKNIKEDIPYYFNSQDVYFSDVDAGDRLSGIYFMQLPTKGKLYYKNQPLKVQETYSPVDSVYFLNNLNENGAYYAEIPFKVADESLKLSDSAYTVIFHVDAMPDAPESSNFTANFYEDSLQSLQTIAFPFSDVDKNKMLGLQIDSLPTKGQLFYENNPAKTAIPYYDLTKLNFLSEKDSFGTNYTRLYFKVIDQTLLLSDSSYRCQIDVIPVNDPPYKLVLNYNHIAEDKPINSIIGNFKAYDIDSQNFRYEFSESSDLSDSDNKSFSLIDSTLYTAITLDYESQYLYSIHVSAFDADNASFGSGFLIYVDDVYENGIASYSSDFVLYPNPVISEMNIKSNFSKPMYYRLINLSGQLVRDLKMIENNRINVSNLKAGTYILELQTENTIVRKLFIKR